MKKKIGLILIVMMALMLAACGKSSPLSGTGKNDTSGKLTVVSVTNKKIEEGLLTVFSAPRHILLAYIDPESGDTSIYRDFSSADPDVEIDPYGYLTNNYLEGKNLIRQSLDADCERIVARNTSTNTWGWVDTKGIYTDVSGCFPADSSYHVDIDGIGFYEGCYYISAQWIPIDKYNKFMEIESHFGDYDWSSASSETAKYALEYNQARSEVVTSVIYNIYKIPVDSIHANSFESVKIYTSTYWSDTDWYPDAQPGEDRTFLIQSDGSSEGAYICAHSQRVDFQTMPVFYDEIEGACVPYGGYGDWVSPEQTVFTDSLGNLYKMTSTVLAGRDCYKVLYDTDEMKEERLLTANNDATYNSPIVSPDHLSVACLKGGLVVSVETENYGALGEDEYVTINDIGSYGSIDVISLEEGSEAMRVKQLITPVISVDGESFEIKKILDWSGNYQTPKLELPESVKAYIDILQTDSEAIKGYKWQMGYGSDQTARAVTVCDIYGDETPELIYLRKNDPPYDYAASLIILTYEDGQVRELYSNEYFDSQAGGASYYYFYQTKDSKNLCAYIASRSDWTREGYSVFEENNGNFDMKSQYEHINKPDYENVKDGALYGIDSYNKNGEKEISESDYNDAVSRIESDTTKILMYSSNIPEFAENFIGEQGCPAMTCSEAINYLKSLAVTVPRE